MKTVSLNRITTTKMKHLAIILFFTTLILDISSTNAIRHGRVFTIKQESNHQSMSSNSFINSLFQMDLKRLSTVDLENLIRLLNKHLFAEENKRKLNQQLEMKREEERRKLVKENLEAHFSASSILRDFYSGRFL